MDANKYNNKLNQILTELDALPAQERFNHLEQKMLKIHQELREEINNEMVVKLKQKTEDTNPIPCSCGKNLYKKDVLKKNFTD